MGRLSENLTSKDLQDYFAQFGQVIDVYIPKPFRAFGFVTFVEADIAQGLCGESHIIKGVSVHVSRADPKEEDRAHGKNDPPPPPPPPPMPPARRFNPGISMSAHQISSMPGGGHNMPPAPVHGPPKSMPPRSKSKYDSHSMHSGDSMYEGRHHEMRQSGAGHHHHHHHSHHGGSGAGSGAGLIGSGSGGSGGGGHHQNIDSMSAMMNMFNPMMAAFIQQLANGIQPPNGSQSGGLDVPAQGMGHHHGVPPPWAGPNEAPYSRGGGSGGGGNALNGPGGMNSGLPNSLSAYNASGYGGGPQHSSRFKSEKF